MRKLYITVAMIAIAIIGSMSARAQGSVLVPPGEQIACVLVCHGIIFIRLASGAVIELPANASGTAVLESTTNHLGGGRTGTRLVPVSIEVSGSDPTYGNYTFTFDATRTATPSEISSNPEAEEAGTEFPATCDVYANVTGTIDGIPGTFTNVTECHMRATNLQSFNPHVNETYTFVNNVVFTDGDEDGDGVQTTFTIPAGATITLN